MRTLKVENNDLVYKNGRLVQLEGIDALEQILGNRLKLFLGEWFLAPAEGVDWIGLVDQGPFLQPGFINAIKTALLKEPSVTSITKLDANFDRAARQVTITFQVQSNLGVLSSTVSGGNL
ncbi:hypothetical protein LEP1GSC050_3082 [Leptospira broomii serovar Hurstbridge str. 5399]|uniref:PF10934 family protein n=1 Tax=Leptospira broomii serovar Hurstbridge str. 5399 TaxID=1049789 RepID=T0GJ44_9LEPT|nr:hypothetical protein [Leptospira broomii]EQA45398.1 hypothetical protein LEP1GSC050_3082 [Leptospira broomii serovar Hurstbridge str. 5399]